MPVQPGRRHPGRLPAGRADVQPPRLHRGRRRQHRRLPAQPGHALLVFTEDPMRFKETLDLAVIVPQCSAPFPAASPSACCCPRRRARCSVRYGFNRWPALVMLQGRPVRRRHRRPAQLGRIPRHRCRRCWTPPPPARPPWAFPCAAPAARPAPAPPERRHGAGPTQGATMKDFPVPVRSIGPGSQPEEDAELDFLPMPRDMNTFAMPRVPEQADPAALAASRDLLAGFLAALQAWDPTAARRARASTCAASTRPRWRSPTRCSAKARSRSRSRARAAGASRRASSPACGAAARSTPRAACWPTGWRPARCPTWPSRRRCRGATACRPSTGPPAP